MSSETHTENPPLLRLFVLTNKIGLYPRPPDSEMITSDELANTAMTIENPVTTEASVTTETPVPIETEMTASPPTASPCLHLSAQCPAGTLPPIRRSTAV